MSKDNSGTLKRSGPIEDLKLNKSIKNSSILNEKLGAIDPSIHNSHMDSKFSRKSKVTTSINRHDEASLEREEKNLLLNRRDSKNLVLKLEIQRKNKPSIDTELVKHNSFDNELEESENKSNQGDKETTDVVRKPSKLSSFESFNKKEDEKVIQLFKFLVNPG